MGQLKEKTQQELIPNKFIPGMKVYLIPNSYDRSYSSFDWANEDNEDLNPDYEYEVESVVSVYIKKVDPEVQTSNRDLPMTYLKLVVGEICGGMGMYIPAYQFWTKEEYLAQKALKK